MTIAPLHDFENNVVLDEQDMNSLLAFHKESLAYKATGPNQILISGNQRDFDRQETRAIALPSGQGVLTLNADGTFSSVRYDFVNGVLTSDTRQFPEPKVPVKGYALASNTTGIPVSELPALNVEPVQIGRTFNGDALGTSVNNRWYGTGITVPTSTSRLFILRVSWDIDGSSTSRDRQYFPGFIIFSDDLNATQGEATVGTVNPVDDDKRVGINLRVSTVNSLISFALTSSREIAFSTSARLSFTGMRISLYEVSDRDAGQYAPFGTANDITTGTIREVRQWTPEVLHTALMRQVTDSGARTSIAGINNQLATILSRLGGLDTSLAAKIDPSNALSLIEAFALKSAGNTSATIPTGRFGNNSIPEIKLSEQVRRKLNETHGITEIITDNTLSGEGHEDDPLRVTNPFTGVATDHEARDAAAAAARTANEARAAVNTTQAEVDAAETLIDQNRRSIQGNTDRFGPIQTKLDRIEDRATADQSATEIRDALGTLTGDDRLDASHIKDLPEGGGTGQGLTDSRLAVLLSPYITPGTRQRTESGIAGDYKLHVSNANVFFGKEIWCDIIIKGSLVRQRFSWAAAIGSANRESPGGDTGSAEIPFNIPSAITSQLLLSASGDDLEVVIRFYTSETGLTEFGQIAVPIKMIDEYPESTGSLFSFRWAPIGNAPGNPTNLPENTDVDLATGVLLVNNDNEGALIIQLKDNQGDVLMPYWIPINRISVNTSPGNYSGYVFYVDRSNNGPRISLGINTIDNRVGFTVANGKLAYAWWVSISGSGFTTDTQARNDIARLLARNEFTDADETKLDGIEAGATADQTSAEIRGKLASLTGDNRLDASAIKNLPTRGGGADTTARQGVADNAAAIQREVTDRTAGDNALSDRLNDAAGDIATALGRNEFTNVEKAKLSGIEANATADQSATEIRDALGTLTGTNRLSAEHIRNIPTGDLTGDIAPFASVFFEPSGISGGSSESDIPDEIAIHIGEKQTTRNLRGISVRFIGAPRTVTGTPIGDFNMHNSGIVYFTIPDAQKAGIASSIRPGDVSKRCTVNFSFTDGTSHSHNLDFGVNKSVYAPPEAPTPPGFGITVLHNKNVSPNARSASNAVDLGFDWPTDKSTILIQTNNRTPSSFGEIARIIPNPAVSKDLGGTTPVTPGTVGASFSGTQAIAIRFAYQEQAAYLGRTSTNRAILRFSHTNMHFEPLIIAAIN